MPERFLGKIVPRAVQPTPLRRAGGHVSWLIAVIAPLVLLGAVFYIKSTLPQPAPVAAASQQQRVMADFSTSRVLAAVTSSSGCTNVINDQMKAANLFPLIPSSLGQKGACPPAYWTSGVIQVLVYKALTLLNWLADILAIIFTVYAGIMYLTGFASEANVKKAKTILIATYVGLGIVLLAKVILYGSIQAVTGKAPDPDNITNPVTMTAPQPGLLVPVAHAGSLPTIGGGITGQSQAPDLNKSLTTIWVRAISAVYYVLSAASVLILIQAGIQYIMSAGNPEKVKKARQTIINVIAGIVLLTAAYGILTLILTLIVTAATSK